MFSIICPFEPNVCTVVILAYTVSSLNSYPFSNQTCLNVSSRSGQQVSEAVTIQVGHAETLLPLLTLLGFFKDSDALRSANFASQSQRSFRTSLMLPYAANFVLVLYDCGGGDIRLQPLLNEKPVTFSDLTDQQASMPLYEHVKESYRNLLQGCDFETECHSFKTNTEV